MLYSLKQHAKIPVSILDMLLFIENKMSNPTSTVYITDLCSDGGHGT